jgi:hypothetical protein
MLSSIDVVNLPLLPRTIRHSEIVAVLRQMEREHFGSAQDVPASNSADDILAAIEPFCVYNAPLEA